MANGKTKNIKFYAQLTCDILRFTDILSYLKVNARLHCNVHKYFVVLRTKD